MRQVIVSKHEDKLSMGFFEDHVVRHVRSVEFLSDMGELIFQWVMFGIFIPEREQS